jgi:hypothetical protein
MHVDVCTQMELFGWKGPAAPGAEKAATAVQVPVYESLQDQEVERVGRLVRHQVLALDSKSAADYERPRPTGAAVSTTVAERSDRNRLA